jgi:hypothetical protein
MAAAVNEKIAAFYMEKIPLKDVLPINKNMNSAQENTMVSTLGSKGHRYSESTASEACDAKRERHTSRRCSRTFPNSMRS